MLSPTNKHYAYRQYGNINNFLLYYESLKNKDDQYSVEMISPGIAYRYQGDFYALLNHLNISSSLWLPCLYLNGLQTPYDYDGVNTAIKIAGEINFPRQ